jgi:hypothetical protein
LEICYLAVQMMVEVKDEAMIEMETKTEDFEVDFS